MVERSIIVNATSLEQFARFLDEVLKRLRFLVIEKRHIERGHTIFAANRRRVSLFAGKLMMWFGGFSGNRIGIEGIVLESGHGVQLALRIEPYLAELDIRTGRSNKSESETCQYFMTQIMNAITAEYGRLVQT